MYIQDEILDPHWSINTAKSYKQSKQHKNKLLKFVLVFFLLFLFCVSGNARMWCQCIILNRHGVTNTCSMWILNVQPHMLQGVQLDCCCNQTTALFETGQIFGDDDRTGRAYLK